MLNTYDITLNTKQGEITIEEIVLHESEGDGDHAAVLAIELLRDEGVKGEITVSNIKCR